MANKAKRERLEDNCSRVLVDRISSLPYDTIVLILSLLPLKEAMATSILSRQWRHTWRRRRRLDLDCEATMEELRRTPPPWDKLKPILHKMRCKLFSWADRLIEGSRDLEQFRLVFDLSVDDQERLDSWLGHVVCPRLERLELVLIDVAHTRTSSQQRRNCYTLPFPGDLGSNNLKQLKLLKTHLVNVSGEAVAFLLQNCPLLEQVSMSASHTLVSLEIAGTHPSFKRLEINHCHELKSVVVRGSGVVCIKYEGKRLEGGFVLEDVPLLTQLWISPMQTPGVFQMFEPVLPQLRVLKILYFLVSYVTTPIVIEEGKMPMLKELVLGVGRSYQKEALLLPLIRSIIHGAPYLERLGIEALQDIKPNTLLDDGCSSIEDYGFDMEDYGSSIMRDIKTRLREIEREKLRRAYSHIRTLEFVGYRGVTSHLEIIKHFAQHSASLESIIIDPRSFDVPVHRNWENRFPRCNIEDDALARESAKAQLNKYAPSKINVKIL